MTEKSRMTMILVSLFEYSWMTSENQDW